MARGKKNIPFRESDQFETVFGTNRDAPGLTVDNITPNSPEEEQNLIDQELAGLLNTQRQTGVGTGPLSRTTLFPGIDDPINKGTFSGKTFSAPIFASGGGLVPFGIEAQRQQRESALAGANLQALQDFQTPDVTRITDERFNTTIQGQAKKALSDIMEEARFKHGADALQFLKTPGTEINQKLNRTLGGLDDIAVGANTAIERIAEVEESLEKGDTTFSDRTLDILDAYKEGIGQFENLDPADLAGIQRQFVGSVNLDKHIKTNILPNLKGDINQFVGDLQDVGGFKKVTTTKVKKVSKERIEAAAKRAERTFRGIFTVDQIEDAIAQSVVSEVNQTAKFLKPPSTGVKTTNQYDVNDIEVNQTRSAGVVSKSNSSKAVKTNIASNALVDHKSDVKSSNPLSDNTYTLDKSQSIRNPEKIVSTTYGETGVYPVYLKGKKNVEEKDSDGKVTGTRDLGGTIIDPKDVDQAKNDQAVIYKVLSFGQGQQKDVFKDKFETVDFYRPADEIRASLVKEGVPLDVLQNEANKLNGIEQDLSGEAAEQEIQKSRTGGASPQTINATQAQLQSAASKLGLSTGEYLNRLETEKGITINITN